MIIDIHSKKKLSTSKGNNNTQENAVEQHETNQLVKGLQEFEKMVRTSNKSSSFERISKGIADLLTYKNNQYGNAVLEPLSIFEGKAKAGHRLDDKLSRVKNSNELRKNDIVDIIGYLYLICEENQWYSFEEFKD